ncbi:Uncharacterized conserved protein UCP006593 [Carpediemonas membranifera]|uniref:Uncharacterized conserved protein UCP006593 n=1 Tax=Carpediemonas membranifera TaxID=201153 RepID=A0A8J6AYK7_9EUKA|nr:Uncharacterized conserved protein UCP006593 [Carpediemonas membranifera]|eukprot:KAG9394605.1 Uncharacterized conserved protein UCP006593 [Carpediemonas membranifera]
MKFGTLQATAVNLNTGGLFSTECIPCAMRQAIRLSRMCAATNEAERTIVQQVMENCSSAATDWNSKGCTSQMISDVYRITSSELLSPDPFHAAKKESNALAKGIAAKLSRENDASHAGKPKERLYHAMRMAVIGNFIDFGALSLNDISDGSLETLLDEMTLKHDEFERLWTDLSEATSLLYLFDNSGEVYLDMYALRVLAEVFPNISSFTLGLKHGPLINDVTMSDIPELGLDSLDLGDADVRFIGFGTPEHGQWPHCQDEDVHELFRAHDVTISKGQGNYEALGPFGFGAYYLLVLKCPIVADLMGLSDVGVGDGVIVNQ